MNTTINKLALAIGALVMAGSAMAADSISADANAKVITPIAVVQNIGLEFGSFSTSAGGQTVAISPAGAPSGTALRSTFGAAVAAGAFTVSGENSYTFSLTMPTTGSVAISNGIGTSAMALSSFMVAPVTGSAVFGGSAPNYTSALSVSGGHQFTVGATLTTVAGQVAGAYTGTYPVTVAYN